MNLKKRYSRLLPVLAIVACGAAPSGAQTSVRERIRAVAGQAGMELPADDAAPTVAAPAAAPVEATLPAAPGETHFQRLQELYAEGTAPSEQDATGAFSGRCYLADSPDAPLGGLLVGVRGPIGSPDGPLFPLEFRVLTGSNYYPFYYDQIFDVDSLDSFIRTNFETVAKASSAGGSMVSRLTVNHPKTARGESRIRKSGPYLVEAFFADQSDDKAGSMCYYFKKVR